MNADAVQAGEGEVTVGRKEKSVLQAKLTKLAIQIGYGGRLYNLLHTYNTYLFIYLSHTTQVESSKNNNKAQTGGQNIFDCLHLLRSIFGITIYGYQRASMQGCRDNFGLQINESKIFY